MFSNLSEKLTQSLNKLRGIGRLTEKHVDNTLEQVRSALIDADVALSVVDQFIDDVRKKAVGSDIIKGVRPGEVFIKLVQDELTHVLGDGHDEINLKAAKPIIILMAGLQGSGKTTTTAKLALHLREQHHKTVMVTSTDIYRPAAIDQLELLAQQTKVHFYPSNTQQKPIDIVKGAVDKAKTQFIDVLLIDTAGRLHIDDELMQEIRAISDASNPAETLLVVDSMTGQDAANIAKTFNDQLELTGIVLTKTDGDARGGAALSMRMITGKPIKYMGVGEKIDALEAFHPDRVASRILGMGDIVSLVEEAQAKVDEKQAEKMAKKLKSGKRFNFNDFLVQLNQMKKLGGMKSLMGKLPGMGQIPKAAMEMMDDKLLVKMEAIINSMTLKERYFPALLNGSRKRRIAGGSGTTIQDVNKLVKQFGQMQKMLKRFKGNKMMKKMKNLQDHLPPELLDKLPK